MAVLESVAFEFDVVRILGGKKGTVDVGEPAAFNQQALTPAVVDTDQMPPFCVGISAELQTGKTQRLDPGIVNVQESGCGTDVNRTV